jgi:hypothetical protein
MSSSPNDSTGGTYSPYFSSQWFRTNITNLKNRTKTMYGKSAPYPKTSILPVPLLKSTERMNETHLSSANGSTTPTTSSSKTFDYSQIRFVLPAEEGEEKRAVNPMNKQHATMSPPPQTDDEANESFDLFASQEGDTNNDEEDDSDNNNNYQDAMDVAVHHDGDDTGTITSHDIPRTQMYLSYSVQSTSEEDSEEDEEEQEEHNKQVLFPPATPLQIPHIVPETPLPMQKKYTTSTTKNPSPSPSPLPAASNDDYEMPDREACELSKYEQVLFDQLEFQIGERIKKKIELLRTAKLTFLRRQKMLDNMIQVSDSNLKKGKISPAVHDMHQGILKIKQHKTKKQLLAVQKTAANDIAQIISQSVDSLL